MCGIVGLAHRRGVEPVSEVLLRSMCDSIQHRGPDDTGIHVGPAVGLGMRRLSIIDLDGGHQPVTNEDGSILLVFNGEIYNYRAIRDGLLARGHTLRTHSDTETIVHLYEEMGERCVEPLRGMFAFALWDEKQQRLLLARDRFGIKPLYIAETGWGIAFASELKALHHAGMTGGALDWDGLDMYMQLGYLPAPYSPFRGVRKLLPAHTLSWQDGRSVTRRYWDLPRGDTPAPRDPEGSVREWLDDSVRAHLESDVPVAAFLSGGIDSSAVVSSMALAQTTPHAFSVRFKRDTSDETGLARLLTDRYGARLTVIDVAPQVRDIFDPIVYALDEPHADESAIPSWLLSQAVAREYKVALSGTGGDELFGGYRRHIGLLIGNAYAALPRLLQRAISTVADALPEPHAGLGVSRVKRFLRARTGSTPERYLELLTRLGDDLRGAVYARELAAQRNGVSARRHFSQLHDEGGAFPGLRAALYLDYRTYLPDDILALADRTSMAHSLELRVPLVDHTLVEHVFPLSDRLKLGGPWRAKRLLRQALAPRLPEAHFRAPKKGFVGPAAAWLRGELREMISDELSADRMKRLGYFDPAAVTRLLSEHLEQRQNRSGVLWNLLCFSTWHRLYVDAGAPRTYQPRR